MSPFPRPPRILSTPTSQLIIPRSPFEPIIASFSLDRDCARKRTLVRALSYRSVTASIDRARAQA